ncbi:MAG: OmpA family protein [Cocleimonas sp.]|nr:OmpA family protein [Cocleimonas sp.]
MKTAMRMTMKTVKTKRIILPIILSTLALGACSQTQNEPGVNASSKDGGKTTVNAGSKNGTVGKGGASNVTSNSTKGNYLPSNNANSNVSDGSDLTLAGLKDPNNLLSQRVIYFDYNQSSIRPEYMVLINTHAKLAAKFPQLKMRLEGHADERGSREYNVALSEQRAVSVRRIMGTQGARSQQIRTIGYGEEIPVVQGHNKKSWQKNRRVEIKYDNY